MEEGVDITFCAGLGDGTKVVDEVSLGHTNTSVAEPQELVLLVWGDADEELLLSVELRGVREGLVADLVEGIRGVGDQFSEENACGWGGGQ